MTNAGNRKRWAVDQRNKARAAWVKRSMDIELVKSATACGIGWARKNDATDLEIATAAKEFGLFEPFFWGGYDKERWWIANTCISPTI